ncbi:uncharacterized protein HD556DRAFT_1307852 [Suillus plorans]|uniref:Uncharacterized protein n=1 Tax=Suillus plorans TaxID=116603 RepID=A0A9P7ARF3_9AGAM|nr:uncharacterized protein HD556DRAFT_1307852 [Suillus plorans]KAG1794853.1 hypothetical protein HD556DRAFT_1307852 [Suillus plorans]
MHNNRFLGKEMKTPYTWYQRISYKIVPSIQRVYVSRDHIDGRTKAIWPAVLVLGLLCTNPVRLAKTGCASTPRPSNDKRSLHGQKRHIFNADVIKTRELRDYNEGMASGNGVALQAVHGISSIPWVWVVTGWSEVIWIGPMFRGALCPPRTPLGEKKGTWDTTRWLTINPVRENGDISGQKIVYSKANAEYAAIDAHFSL